MPGTRISTVVLLVTASLAFVASTASSQSQCSQSRVPAEMPAVDAVVDSAAIAALIAGSGAEGVLRFSIVSDAGSPPRVYPIVGEAASPASEWLTPRIEAALRPLKRSSAAWGVRLVASADSAPVMLLERSEYCRAQLKPSATRATVQVVRRSDSPQLRFPTYTVSITSGGNVRGVTFIRPGDRDIETQVRRNASGMRYNSARMDGVPVASVDTLGSR